MNSQLNQIVMNLEFQLYHKSMSLNSTKYQPKSICHNFQITQVMFKILSPTFTRQQILSSV